MFGAISQAQVTASAQQKFTALRQALEDCADFYQWISAYTASDLSTALGFTSADATSLLTAAADANELASLYDGGALGAYTLPYNFSASQRVIIGP